MQTLIKSEVKLKMASFNNSTFKVKEKSNHSKLSLVFPFYQKLFLILLASFTLLIFPESPKSAEVVCKKYHPIEACSVW